jgi:shikimate 5-dehydrogenase
MSARIGLCETQCIGNGGRVNAKTTAAVDLTGRVSMVTGAAGGIGRVIAAELARLGSTVVIVSRRAEAGEQLRRQIAAQAGRPAWSTSSPRR